MKYICSWRMVEKNGRPERSRIQLHRIIIEPTNKKKHQKPRKKSFRSVNIFMNSFLSNFSRHHYSGAPTNLTAPTHPDCVLISIDTIHHATTSYQQFPVNSPMHYTKLLSRKQIHRRKTGPRIIFNFFFWMSCIEKVYTCISYLDPARKNQQFKHCVAPQVISIHVIR